MVGLALLVVVAALIALAAAPAAEAGMHVGAMVCFEAIALNCIGTCLDTMLSPPDLCPKVTLPI